MDKKAHARAKAKLDEAKMVASMRQRRRGKKRSFSEALAFLGA